MSNKIPHLEHYISCAYNAKDGDFLGKPVFKTSYKGKKEGKWNGKDIVYPDCISLEISPCFEKHFETIILENQAEYNRSFSAAANIKYSGICYSSSVNSSLLFHGSLFVNDISTYSLNCCVKRLLQFEHIDEYNSLEAGFINRLKKLPKHIDTDEEQEKYFKFFDDYGTHYAKKGTMGGCIIMQTEIKDTLIRQYSKSKIKGEIKGGYSSAFSKGSISASAAYENSEFLSEHKESLSIDYFIMGGSYEDEVKAWDDTLYITPILLISPPGYNISTKFVAISELVPEVLPERENSIKENIEVMIQKYVAIDKENDGLISYPTEIDLGRVYKAQDGDGFLIGTIKKKLDGDRGTLEAYCSDQNNPDIMRVCASQHSYDKDDRKISCASLTMPVAQDMYYQIRYESTFGQPEATATFVPFGSSSTKMLKSWSPVELGTRKKAESHGFVVSYVTFDGQDGPRGYVLGKQQLNNSSDSDDDYTTIAGASQHDYPKGDNHVPFNSFCMPVKKDTYYQIDFEKTFGEPKAKAFFIPLADNLEFCEDISRRDKDTVYRSEYDGFLVAFLDYGNEGARGYVDLYCHHDVNFLRQSATPIASTSVHHYLPTDSRIPYNTAMIPVPKRAYYKAIVTNTSHEIEANIFWISVKEKSIE